MRHRRIAHRRSRASDAAPNGIGLSPDERTLYVAETEGGRLWAFDIQSPGVIARRPFPSPNGGRFLFNEAGYHRFDSLAVEASGNICVATLISGAITVVAPDGQLVRRVKTPDIYTTNICFGGPDMKTAYVTLSGVGQLVALPWPERGLKLNFLSVRRHGRACPGHPRRDAPLGWQNSNDCLHG